MGTRGFLGFVIDEVEKIGYNHFDSYPEGLGFNVLKWLRDVEQVAALDAARALRVVQESDEPSEEDVNRLHQYLDDGVGERREHPSWYQLLRRTQGSPEAILNAGVVEDASEFPADSLFAEWGYVVDFDTKTFEVYEGFQKEPHTKGRFYDRPSATRGYFPVALVASWPLSELPDEETFIKLFAAPQDDENG